MAMLHGIGNTQRGNTHARRRDNARENVDCKQA